jgi:hypothetical protein
MILMFLDTDQGRGLSYLTFDPDESYEDSVLHIKFHLCGSGCRRGDFSAPFFHRRCFDFARPLQLVTSNFLAATEYSFQPSLYEGRRRLDRIRNLLPARLSKVLPRKLPREILAMVAKLLESECAIVTAQQQTLGDEESGILLPDFIIDLTRNVYAQYYELDGVCYVKTLSNSRPETGKDQRLLFDAQQGGRVHKVLVAEDHLGIRSVRFASCNAVSDTHPVPRAWWKDISGPGGVTKMRATTDVRRTAGWF